MLGWNLHLIYQNMRSVNKTARALYAVRFCLSSVFSVGPFLSSGLTVCIQYGTFEQTETGESLISNLAYFEKHLTMANPNFDHGKPKFWPWHAYTLPWSKNGFAMVKSFGFAMVKFWVCHGQIENHYQYWISLLISLIKPNNNLFALTKQNITIRQ